MRFATDSRSDDAELLGIEAVLANDDIAHGDWVLAGDPDSHEAVFAGNGEAAVWLHRDTSEALAVDAAFDDLSGAFERVAIFEADAGLEDHVAAVLFEDDRSAVLQRFLSIGDDGEWLVVGNDCLGCIFRFGSR